MLASFVSVVLTKPGHSLHERDDVSRLFVLLDPGGHLPHRQQRAGRESFQTAEARLVREPK